MSRRKREFRWAKWLVFLVLIIGAIVVVILVKNNFDKKPDNNTPQAANVNKPEKKKEEKTNDSDGTKEEPKQEEKTPQYDGESPNKSETLTGMITYANVMDGELVIRTNIDQFLQTGSCNLVISRNGVTYYTSTVGIQESVTTSTCDGYKIPIGELSEGDFSVEIGLESGEKSGKITGRVRI